MDDDINLKDDAAQFQSIRRPTHIVTQETQLVDHWISDDQLMLLAHGGKDKSFDLALAATTFAVGVFQNFYSLLVEVIEKKPIPTSELVGSAFFFIAITAAVLGWLSYWHTKTDVDLLIASIRGRQRMRIPEETNRRRKR